MKQYLAFVSACSRTIWFWNILFTLACLVFILLYKTISVSVFISIKSLGYTASYFFEYYLNPVRLYFYRNAGFSFARVLSGYIFFDLAVLLFLSLCILLIMTR